jgi:two-component system, chemotaxis family, CheB/CheR fusion protein
MGSYQWCQLSKVNSEIADRLEESSGKDENFEALLLYLKQSRGFDFTAYKRSSLMRRVQVRMQAAGIGTFPEYHDYLQVDPDEFTRLFNTILINVTSFFRDGPTWTALADTVLPALLSELGPTDPIRVWSAGCASGEEAYTVAMLLAEAVGPDQFRERVKIYGTDVDEEALNQARVGSYDARAVEEVPPELLQKYFDRVNDRFIFSKELRRRVIFGRHDLIQDAPISRVGLLTCRNCLMYFNAEAQARILARFHFALREHGILILGKAETLLTHSINFGAVDVKRRIFTKSAGTESGEPRNLATRTPGSTPEETSQRLIDGSSDLAPLAQLLVDNTGRIVQVNGQLRTVFGVSSRDVGRPLQDLELSYRPFELRSCIERAYTERRPIVQKEGRWVGPAGQPMFFDLLVVPVPETNGTFLGCSVVFTDVTRARTLQEEVQRTHQELETALEELQSTNEELETTNEELQSTVEELETTNEELQSTNEELETMNEELQSTNEELQTINDEVRERSDEVMELNSFLESILTSLRGAVVMLDRDLQIHKWNHRAEDMWGLRAEEVLHRNFLNLDIGLPVEQLKAPVKACLAKEAEFLELTLESTNRRGKRITVKVTCTQLSGAGAEPTGVILVMEEVPAPA